MKKSIAILSILCLLSCNNDDEKQCMCDAYYTVSDKPDIYKYANVEMDCNTKKPLENLDEKLPKDYKNLTFNDCNFDK